MKKTYETPTVEKISFNYRDQVVAASGDPQSPGGNYTSGDICTVINWVAREWGDWQLCFS